MDTQELQNLEKVSTIRVKNFVSIISKINSSKSLMTDIKLKDEIKMDIAKIDKFETYPQENVLPKNGFYRNLY